MTTTQHPAASLLSRLLFFGWNGLFLCTMGAGFVPLVWWSLLQDAVEGRVPLDFIIFSNVAVLIPVAATGLGVKFWRSPWRLLRLFYCVELPLFMLCLYRLFGIHELTLGSSVLFGFVALGALGQLSSLLRVAPPPGAWRYLDLSLRTVSLMAALYIGLLASFFALPTAFVIVEVFSSSMFLVVPLALFALSGLVLILWPAVSVIASLRGYWSAVQLILRSRRLGAMRAAFVTALTVGLIAGGFSALPSQPQQVVRDLLASDAPLDDATRLRRIEQAETIRAGLINGYLARYRYVADRSTDEGTVRSAYWHTVGLPLEWSEGLQGAWNTLTGPLLYDGDIHADRAWAKEEYSKFFDEPIERAEREAIVSAFSATFRREDREAGMLDIDRRRVWLAAQDIRVSEEDGYADVELHEVYENQTYDQEEVAYYFSLPESAVVTGLWLGTGPDRTLRDRFVVAPRGAAQAVYKAEVQRRVDPALIEQVGPRQYRLRAFPVPPREYRQNSDTPTPRMHLWLTYRTLATGEVWPLPVLAEKRNIFFDRRTARALNGVSWRSDEDWMPAPMTIGRSSIAATGVFDLGAGTAMRVRRAPSSPGVTSLSGRNLVVVDRSYSMAAHTTALAKAAETLRSAVSDASQLHFLLGPTRDRPEPLRSDDLDLREVVFYGSSRSAELLAAIETELAKNTFDAVFVLTDEGSYESETDRATKRDLGVPVFWVHVGGRLPRAYDDTTIETIQRRGGAAVTSAEEAIVRLHTERSFDGRFVSLVDGLVFELVDADGTERTSELSAIAARQLVSGAMRTGAAQGLEGLDRMHALAKRFEIVTPYSSMLVLVEDRQRLALEAAEKADDRFEREVEHGTEHGGPSITGTPEPEEWALFFFGLALAGLVARRRTVAAVPYLR